MVQAYPAIWTHEGESLDGVIVRQGTNPLQLTIRSKGGRVYRTVEPFQAFVAYRDEQDRPAWVIRGMARDPASRAELGEETFLVQWSERSCGCGGPQRKLPSLEQLDLIARFDEIADDQLPI